MSEYQTVRFEQRGSIAIITLNRPDAGNSFNPLMTEELGSLWNVIKFNDDISVVIVTGAGQKHFCTGADFRGAKHAEVRSKYITRDEGIRQLTSKHVQCWKPVITAINGTVVGGGFHFVTAGDINIASNNATFFDTHVEINLLPVFEPIELALRMPREAVSRLFLLGRDERMNAQRAYELGLISEVVSPERLMPRAFELAEILAKRDLTVLMATVELIHKSREVGTRQAIQHGLTLREIAGWSHINLKRS